MDRRDDRLLARFHLVEHRRQGRRVGGRGRPAALADGDPVKEA